MSEKTLKAVARARASERVSEQEEGEGECYSQFVVLAHSSAEPLLELA